ncbi:Mitoferrin [Trichinella pseudospiralis]|uniref:Mitoferrin n=1 Tax=Trichinella pseudospiralis TaxID=6337 RepID=A0A0V0XXA3_TRIPS|nr:Mitoferrin [Trichinella pseudospiralis]
MMCDLQPEYEELPTHSLYVHLLAGAAAGTMEHCLFYPIDSVKTRMQSLCRCPEQSCRTPVAGLFSMVRREGFLRSLRGINAIATGSVPAHALYFTVYEKSKLVLTNGHLSSNSFAPGIAGILATLVHDAVMNPVEVIKQRMQVWGSPYKSSIECAKCVYNREGVCAFYRSYSTQLLMNIPFQVIHFLTYEQAQQRLNPKRLYDPKSHVISGAVAGGLAAAATTPLDVCKTALNTQPKDALHCRKSLYGIGDAVRAIYACKGFNGFWSGLQARVLFQVPTTAMTWMDTFFNVNFPDSNQKFVLIATLATVFCLFFGFLAYIFSKFVRQNEDDVEVEGFENEFLTADGQLTDSESESEQSNADEEEMQKQLLAIYEVMKKHENSLGPVSMEDLRNQMKLYLFGYGSTLDRPTGGHMQQLIPSLANALISTLFPKLQLPKEGQSRESAHSRASSSLNNQLYSSQQQQPMPQMWSPSVGNAGEYSEPQAALAQSLWTQTGRRAQPSVRADFSNLPPSDFEKGYPPVFTQLTNPDYQDVFRRPEGLQGRSDLPPNYVYPFANPGSMVHPGRRNVGQFYSLGQPNKNTMTDAERLFAMANPNLFYPNENVPMSREMVELIEKNERSLKNAQNISPADKAAVKTFLTEATRIGKETGAIIDGTSDDQEKAKSFTLEKIKQSDPLYSRQVKMPTFMQQQQQLEDEDLEEEEEESENEESSVELCPQCINVNLKKMVGPWTQIFGNADSLNIIYSTVSNLNTLLSNDAIRQASQYVPVKPTCVGMQISRPRKHYSEMELIFQNSAFNTTSLRKVRGIIKQDRDISAHGKALELQLNGFNMPLCVIKVGPSLTTMYSYMILTELSGSNRCRSNHVFARKPELFARDHGNVVNQYLKEQFEKKNMMIMSALAYPQRCLP